MKKLFFVLFTIILTSCKSDSENGPDPQDILDAEFYQNYYDQNIAPSIATFKNEIETEIQYIQNFQASQTDENFEAIANQWLICAKAYAKASVYDFGEIENDFHYTLIFNFPIATTFIEDNIAEDPVFDSNYFQLKSTTSKGLGTMEYLIYSNNNIANAKNLLIDNPQRLNYLLAVAQEVLNQTNKMIAAWEDGYKDTFINANESKCSNNATCLAVNQFINILDVTKVTKIGKTAGFESSSTLQPQNLEAFRSRSSLILIQAMLEEVKKAFQEGDTNFATIVNQIDDSGLITKAIDAKFDEIDLVIADFNSNLYDAILTDTASITPIYNSLKELTILFSVDVASTLSITVLPTDNDGD